MTLLMTSLSLSRVFSMFFYFRSRFRFTLIGRNLTAQSTEVEFNFRDVVARSPSFSRPATRAPWIDHICHRLYMIRNQESDLHLGLYSSLASANNVIIL